MRNKKNYYLKTMIMRLNRRLISFQKIQVFHIKIKITTIITIILYK